MLLPFLVLCGAVLGWAKELPQASEESSSNYDTAKCYGELGCFSIDGDFSGRLINLFPFDRKTLNTQFLLYTRNNSNQHDFLRAGNITSLRRSFFSSSRPTKFIVHGFVENGFMPWVKKMVQEFLIKGDFNVIGVDWEGGSFLPYTQATANTRLVGAEISLLVKFLQTEVGVKTEDVHIIGHSLGSHIAGYAGERLPGLGRITGLDPADPYFQDMPISVRLDPTDANYVDVLHTDVAHIANLAVLNGGFGLRQPVGHADFYPNGGVSQPGCDQSVIERISGQGLLEGSRKFVACNHFRAVHFFTESINSRCPYKAYPCSTYEDFKKGACIKCNDPGCSKMGYSADESKPMNGKTNVKYFLQTGGEPPFCRYHYQIIVTLANPAGAASQKGTVKVQLYGSRGMSDELPLSENHIDMEPGNSYVKLVTQARDLGDLQKVAVTWGCDSDMLLPWNWCMFRTTKLYVRGVQVVSGDSDSSFQFAAKGEALEPDVKRAFLLSG